MAPIAKVLGSMSTSIAVFVVTLFASGVFSAVSERLLVSARSFAER